MTSTTSDKMSAEVIRADRRGRLLIGAEQRAALLDAFENSSISAMAFSRQHGLSYSTFANWVQMRRKATAHGVPESLAVSKPAFAEVFIEEKKSVPIKPHPPLHVTLRSGVSFEICSPEQMPLVIELIQCLNPPRSC